MATATPPSTRKLATGDLTPAMRQYVEQKTQAGDAILLFRMGDFYEMFFDDAVTASRVLGLTLTARSKGANAVPLAGIPYHALDSYLAKLVAAGFKVAVSEQVEDPKQAKGIVKREIVRIVTAGTLTDETLLDERSDNVLASIARGASGIGLATVELVSGRFRVFAEASDSVLDELVRIRPAEVLIDEEADATTAGLADELRSLCKTAVARRSTYEFSEREAVRTLHGHFSVATLEGFGITRIDAGVRAAGAIITYLTETQKTSLAHIHQLEPQHRERTMLIDHHTWRALEIERTVRGGSREGSLLHAIDRTVHPTGARLLRHWLSRPLVDLDAITARQDVVAAFVESERARSAVRSHLRRCADIERIAARTVLGRATPRDLVGLSNTLSLLPAIRDVLSEFDPPQLRAWCDHLDGLGELTDLLHRAVRSDAPMTVREGGIIADGYDAELDELRGIRRDGQTWLAEYQKRQIERTAIPSLKVAFNRVFGFYIEVSNAHRDKVPVDYVRKQTIKSAERYITDELKVYENKVLSAEDKANDLEYRLFGELCERVATHVPALQRAAGALSGIDCTAGAAELAVERRYIRPEVYDGDELTIVEGRHPVLEQIHPDRFVSNDTRMETAARLWVITGPNMSGKSTYMRQTALLGLLAQIGSYVPAKSMRIGLVDRVFARVGASDELTRDMSTFMVEMTEAANIVNNATSRSLVVLDEIGRGTSTFDGLSLAWAIAEHLADETRCRTLVATHYHEMTALAGLHEGVVNYNVAVREQPDAADESERVVFLHKIVPGACDQSYGLHVARMAGLPARLVERSAELLSQLEDRSDGRGRSKPIIRRRTRTEHQLALFAPRDDGLAEALRDIDPDNTTPLDALRILKELKDKADSG